MKFLKTSDTNFKSEFKEILNRGRIDIGNVEEIVKNIIDDVKKRGDEALIDSVKKFDKWEPKSFDDMIIKKEDMKKAYDNLDKNLKEALEIAFERIKKYHQKQLPKSWIDFEENGTILGQKVTPVKRAGVYVPGGKAFYPSSLLMNVIPALVAGVEEIIVTTPTPENNVNELLLAALYICNSPFTIKVGGASAIAALAYSTEHIPKVDVITGPGNIFVATAKKIVYGDVNIDMIAGPSEIGIIADKSANVEYLAIDFLSQAEHDEMASSILITPSYDLAVKVKEKIYELLNNLSRKEIAKASVENRGVIIVSKDLDEAIALMNEIAPEHLEVVVNEPFSLLPKIKNAGAIFLGENTPEAIGDYIAGPNHTLPTGGSAKFFSPLSVEHFMKKSSIIYFSEDAIKELADPCAKIADVEGLQAHKESVLIRK
jgi:histidinol dehydrogenase